MSLILLKNRTLKPAQIFNAGQQGFWFDAVTPGVLFQDSAGTTPVSAAEQPTGLVLDRSQGMVLGPELVTNGGFDTDTTGWSVTAGNGTIAVENGELKVTSGTGGIITSCPVTLVIGKMYYVSAVGRRGTFTDNIQFGVALSSSGTPGDILFSTTAATQKAFINTATQTTVYVVIRFPSVQSGATAYFDNISVREISGYHAAQTTAAARPTSRRRVNLLTYSEDFTNAVWVNSNTSISVAAGVTPPPGFSVSYKLTESAVTNNHVVYSPSGFTLPRVSHTFRAIVKAAERAWVALGLYRQAGGNTMVWFNLTTGQKGSSTQAKSSPFSYSISAMGDGWYECRLDLTSNDPVQCAIYTATGDAVSSYLGDGSSGVYVAAADLRAYYNADKYASYQKVAAADVYTTEGFPLYVAFDKVDDRLLITVPTGGFVGTLVLATTEGTAAYGVNIPAGTWALGANTTTGTIYFPGTAIVGAICRHSALSDGEIARCIAYLQNKGGGPANYSGITTFANYWRNAAWLTGFVANAFNGSTATDFTNAFTGCALDQTSVDNILVSINSNGTSGGTLNLTGGTNSAPSATGAAAVTALQSRSWTVTTN